MIWNTYLRTRSISFGCANETSVGRLRALSMPNEPFKSCKALGDVFLHANASFPWRIKSIAVSGMRIRERSITRMSSSATRRGKSRVCIYRWNHLCIVKMRIRRSEQRKRSRRTYEEAEVVAATVKNHV